jgi:hypothetical protein
LLEKTKTTIEQGEADLTSSELFELWSTFNQRFAQDESGFSQLVGEAWGDQEQRGGEPFLLSLVEAVPDIESIIANAKEQDRVINEEAALGYLWDISDADEPELRVSYANMDVLRDIAKNKPTFVLATEWPRKLSETVFDLPVVEVTDNLKPKVDILQLSTASAGITALEQDKRLAENLRELTALAVKRESQRDRKTLIVAKKDLKDGIRQTLDDEGLTMGREYELAHYYGLSGSNQYEECGAVILHGKPGFSDDVLKVNQVMTGIAKEELAFEKLQGEIRDALHRIRPAQKGGVQAYIWTNEVDFELDFDGQYDPKSVTEIRELIQKKIEYKKKQQKKREKVLKELKQYDGWITGTEFKQEIGEQYRSVRDNLVNDGKVEHVKESTGGRPRKKYRYNDSVQA